MPDIFLGPSKFVISPVDCLRSIRFVVSIVRMRYLIITRRLWLQRTVTNYLNSRCFAAESPSMWLDQLNWITETDPAGCPNNCGRMYKGPYRKRHLRQHLVYECGVPPKFQCNYCSKRFARKPQLKCHLIAVHKTFYWRSAGFTRGAYSVYLQWRIYKLFSFLFFLRTWGMT